ncbi:MAG: hypothetical protein Q9183_006822, partial [Haloplaca sp. 2 TL-2023]
MLRPDPEPRISYDEWEKQQYEKSLLVEGKAESLVQDKVRERAREIGIQRSATSAKLQSMMRGVLREEKQPKMAEMPRSRTSAKLENMMRGVLEQQEDRKVVSMYLVSLWNPVFSGHLGSNLFTRHTSPPSPQITKRETSTMAPWIPPPWFFGAIAGGIVGLILAIGLIFILINCIRDRRLERDLEANQKAKEQTDMAQLPTESVPAQETFVDVDLSDPVVRTPSVYAKIRRGLSRSRV